MRNNTAKYYAILIVCAQFLLASGCGKGFTEDESAPEELANAFYKSDLKSINTRMGNYYGWAGISIQDNQFWTRVKIHGRKTGSMHAQYIHSGSKCPDMSDDLNKDGYLDFAEIYNVVGPIILPLDTNLNSQIKGQNDFPKMNKHSFYYYSEACQSARLMEDLRRKDGNAYDMMRKLHSGEELALNKRVLIIYGTSSDRNLPSTISSFEGYPAHMTIPIACGEITEGATDEFD